MMCKNMTKSNCKLLSLKNFLIAASLFYSLNNTFITAQIKNAEPVKKL